MANGDIAAASGFFTPVPATDDLKLGYDRINTLADAAAKVGGAAGWAMGSIGPAHAGNGFGSLRDPNDGTGAGGGIKSLGPGLFVISLRLTYSGASVAPTNGNITPDLQCMAIAGAYRPTAPRFLRWANGITGGNARLDPDGALYLCDIAANTSLVSGNIVQIDGIYPK